MHLSEGVLDPQVLGAGAALAAAGVGYGLYKLDYDRIPKVAVMTSAFFVVSLIHVPAGPGSVHLILNGLAGLLLGWAAFPALLVALLLQAVFFQFGGLTTLGVNVMTMAFPAVVSYHLFHRVVAGPGDRRAAAAAFACGVFSVALSSLLYAGALLTAGRSFLAIAVATLALHLPVMAIEGFVTLSAVSFLRKVDPAVLNAPLRMEAPHAR